MWYLIVIILTSGFISADAKITKLEFKNKDACLIAKNTLEEKSKSVGYLCISSETGQVIK